MTQNNKKVILLRVDETLKLRLEMIATREKKTLNKLVTEMLEDAITQKKWGSN